MLGQFLAHLEIFAEGSTVVRGFQECHGPANASLQNERFSFGIEGPSPVEILKASPSRTGAQSTGPIPRSTSRKLGQTRGQRSISWSWSLCGSWIDPRGTLLEPRYRGTGQGPRVDGSFLRLSYSPAEGGVYRAIGW